MNNLKSALLKLSILSLTAVVFQATAQANYQCVSKSGNTSLTIKEFSMQRVGNASIEINPIGEKSILLYGYSSFENGSFNKKKDLIFGISGEKLTLAFQPLVCNRASCDLNAGVLITGFLKIDEPFENSYFCHELLD
jgi:hypothetical protein